MAIDPMVLIEYNEYLRIQDHGEKIMDVRIDGIEISVDTVEELEILRRDLCTTADFQDDEFFTDFFKFLIYIPSGQTDQYQLLCL